MSAAVRASGGPRVIFDHPLLRLETEPKPTASGTAEWLRLRLPHWVNVVAETASGEIVLVRQERFGTATEEWEIPGGVVDPGEDPLAAGLRELEEETGFSGGTARLVTWLYPNPALQDNRLYVVHVTGLGPPGAPRPDEGERIEVFVVPRAEVAAMLDDGRLRHALVVAALRTLIR